MLSDTLAKCIERLSNDQKRYKLMQPCKKAVVAEPETKPKCAITLESQPVSLASKFAEDILKYTEEKNKPW